MEALQLEGVVEVRMLVGVDVLVITDIVEVVEVRIVVAVDTSLITEVAEVVVVVTKSEG